MGGTSEGGTGVHKGPSACAKVIYELFGGYSGINYL